MRSGRFLGAAALFVETNKSLPVLVAKALNSPAQDFRNTRVTAAHFVGNFFLSHPSVTEVGND